MTRRPFLRVFVSPAVLCALVFAAALGGGAAVQPAGLCAGLAGAGGLDARKLHGAPAAALRAGVSGNGVDLLSHRILYAHRRISARLCAGARQERCAQVGDPGDHRHPAVPRRGGAHLFVDCRARQQRIPQLDAAQGRADRDAVATHVHAVRRRHRPRPCHLAGDGDHAGGGALRTSIATTSAQPRALAPGRSAPFSR